MRVLVSLDGSRFSEAVLPVVAEMAEREDIEVTLLTVLNPSDLLAFPTGRQSGPEEVKGQWDISGGPLAPQSRPARAIETNTQAAERINAEAKDYLERVERQFFPKGAAKVVLTGDHPAEELIRWSVANKVGLIAMATHGHTGLGRFIMGSVAEEVVRAGVAPVLLVRPAPLAER